MEGGGITLTPKLDLIRVARSKKIKKAKFGHKQFQKISQQKIAECNRFQKHMRPYF